MPTTRNIRCVVDAVRMGCLAAGLALANVSAGKTYEWSLNAGADHSDNINRTDANEESETAAEAGVTLQVDAERPRLQTKIAADLRYRDYLDDVFGDETVGGLDGTVNLGVIPERIIWVVRDNYGQIAIEPAAIETPANRQDFNYFTTGPDFIIPLGARTELALQGRWSDVYYEESLVNNQRYAGALALSRRISEASSLSLHGGGYRVEFDDSPPNSDYDVQAAYVQYSATGARTTLSVDVGYTVLHDSGESNDAPLGRLSVSREVGARSTLALELGTEYSDTAGIFELDQRLWGVELENNAAVPSADPFQADYAYASWQTSGDRTTFVLSAHWREESHETESELDRELVRADVAVSRLLTGRLTATINGSRTQQEFAAFNEDLDDWELGGGLSFRVNANVSLQLRVSHYEGAGTGPTREYQENRGYLGVSYAGRR